MSELAFDQHGAQRFRCALSHSEVQFVLAVLKHLPTDAAGSRIGDAADLAPLMTAQGPIGSG